MSGTKLQIVLSARVEQKTLIYDRSETAGLFEKIIFTVLIVLSRSPVRIPKSQTLSPHVPDTLDPPRFVPAHVCPTRATSPCGVGKVLPHWYTTSDPHSVSVKAV